jgi:hypothetical protein
VDVHDEVSEPVLRNKEALDLQGIALSSIARITFPSSRYTLRRNDHHAKRGERSAAPLELQAGPPEGNLSIIFLQI